VVALLDLVVILVGIFDIFLIDFNLFLFVVL